MVNLRMIMSLTSYQEKKFLLYSYLMIEIVFYIIYKYHLKPKTNDLSSKKIQPYRDYGKQRHLLFKRILDRMEIKCKIEQKELRNELHSFLKGWFLSTTGTANANNNDHQLRKEGEKHNHHSNCTISSSSNLSSESSVPLPKYEKECFTPFKEDLLEFFTWAFFDKEYKHLTEDWEKEELDKMFHLLSSKYGFVYPSYYDVINNHNTSSIGISNRSDNHNIQDSCTKQSPFKMSRMKPKRMTLEQCNPLHRPLLLYIFFITMRYIGYVILYCMGFRRYTISIPSALTLKEDQSIAQREEKVLYYWLLQHGCNFKCSTDLDRDGANRQQAIPTLFFHGIAPAGLTFYIPMLYNTIMKREQQSPIFLFENLPITCTLVFDVLTEEQTVYGVEQALSCHGFSHPNQHTSNRSTISLNCNEAKQKHEKDKVEIQEDQHRYQKDEIIICGHSFGSFQITWLLRSKSMKQRIKKVVLLDPVCIMLSEPDVVTNFLYNHTGDTVFYFQEQQLRQKQTKKNGEDGNYITTFMNMVECINKLKIRILCSSELGIEYYLRRHFAWYNSELWLEDIFFQSHSSSMTRTTRKNSVDVSIYIAEKDEIIDSAKVVNEIQRFPNVKLTYWKDVGHAAILTRSEFWLDLSCEFSESGKNSITSSVSKNKVE